MPESLAQQRCWNHATRGAVCRCPVCQRHFCRECVSEHDARLLCGGCIRVSAAAQDRPHSRARRIGIPLLAVGTAVLAWVAFFSLGQVLRGSATLAELSAWHNR